MAYRAAAVGAANRRLCARAPAAVLAVPSAASSVARVSTAAAAATGASAASAAVRRGVVVEASVLGAAAAAAASSSVSAAAAAAASSSFSCSSSSRSPSSSFVGRRGVASSPGSPFAASSVVATPPQQSPAAAAAGAATTTTQEPSLPKRARVVVVGGGIVGASAAYHLAKAGVSDVLLLEQSALTAGTTWHAAGLCVTFGSLSETSTRWRQYSQHLYRDVLEAETGQETGFADVGFIELATSADRLTEFRRVASFNRHMGVDVREISPAEVKERFPLARVDDVLAGFLVEGDGRVNPVDATMALAKGARMHGATLVENVTVSDMTRANGRVTGVTTAGGQHVEADFVVMASGMWARQMGARAGVAIPNQAAEHYYLVTDAMPEVDRSWPVIEDPSSYTYIRPEAGGLMVGLFEPEAAAWSVDQVPGDFSFGEIQPDWERMGPFVEKAMSRVPATLDVGAKKFFCGPESFTPDLAPLVGEVPELRNLFVAAGLNSIGILTGGGIGRFIAEWVRTGAPDQDATGVNIERMHPFQANAEYRAARVVESLGMVYKCHYPAYSMKTARNAKRSPLYDRLAARGAYFRDVSSWECADWFANRSSKDKTEEGGSAQEHTPAGATEPVVDQLTWNRHNWFPNWAAEHRACREGVVLVDMSFMSKFLVQGPDAGRMLNYLSTADVDGDAGMITYTQWLSRQGRMEADLTVAKLPNPAGGAGSQRYMVVATDTAHRHVERWMTRFIEGGEESFGFDALADEADALRAAAAADGAGAAGDAEGAARAAEDKVLAERLHDERRPLGATVTDVSGALAQINIQGPRSRELMQLLAPGTDFANDAFPFRAVREIEIGNARLNCVRITYLGELGYELYIPVEAAIPVYDRIVQVGEAQCDLVHAGLKALASLRLEKAYRDHGHDTDNTDTLAEVGLAFTADFEKPGGFRGRGPALAQKEAKYVNLPQRLLQVLVKDPEPMLFHGEVVWRNGVRVGDVRAGSYGHTLGGAVGLAMVAGPSDVVREEEGIATFGKKYIEQGTWEVEIDGKLYPAQVSLQPLYDPKNDRIKA